MAAGKPRPPGPSKTRPFPHRFFSVQTAFHLLAGHSHPIDGAPARGNHSMCFRKLVAVVKVLGEPTRMETNRNECRCYFRERQKVKKGFDSNPRAGRSQRKRLKLREQTLAIHRPPLVAPAPNRRTCLARGQRLLVFLSSSARTDPWASRDKYMWQRSGCGRRIWLQSG